MDLDKKWSDLTVIGLIAVLIVFTIEQSYLLQVLNNESSTRNQMLQEMKTNDAMRNEILQQLHADNIMRNNVLQAINQTLNELSNTKHFTAELKNTA